MVDSQGRAYRTYPGIHKSVIFSAAYSGFVTLVKPEKIQILNKHIKLNKLEPKYSIFSDALKRQIAKHPNFSPRIIEFITDKSRITDYKSDYRSFVLSCLDNPEEIIVPSG